MPPILNGCHKFCDATSTKASPSVGFLLRAYQDGDDVELFVPMNGFRGKGWYANSNVFGTVRIGGAILDPFSSVGNDGLSGMDVNFFLLSLDVERPSQDERIFVKFRSLVQVQSSHWDFASERRSRSRSLSSPAQ